MKRKMLEFGMAVVLLFCAYLVSREGAAAITANTSVVKKDNVIVLDAGHGGSDPGKIGINNAKEKEINLQITNKLKDLLEANDYTVVMTRKTDAGLYQDSDSNKKIADMKKRCEIIQEVDPIITVSIHQNSYEQESVHGPQIFYFSHSDQAKVLAESIQEALNTGLKVDKPRVAKANDNYYLLKKTSCPTVIVECGFLSNQAEANKLIDDAYQDELVTHIFKGVEDYIKQLK